MSMVAEDTIQKQSYGRDKEYYVAPFISDIFTNHIKGTNLDFACYLKILFYAIDKCENGFLFHFESAIEQDAKTL